MKSLEMAGRTVEEAVRLAVSELGVDENEVDVEILDGGSRGFLGLLGTKQARVRVTVKETIDDKIDIGEQFLTGLLQRMGIEGQIDIATGEDNIVHFHVRGRRMGSLIGRRGQTLDAVQYLVNLVANRDGGQRARIVIDAEGYREKRAETLRELALRFADRAKTEGRRMALDPMSALERRVVHMALADEINIETLSEGEEPYRRVIIVPKRT